MPKPTRHVFVCINQRAADDPKGCCAAKGSAELIPLFKQTILNLGLSGVRVSKAQCLGPCEHGVNVVVYPDNVWYRRVKTEHVELIVRQHLLGGQPVTALLNPEFL